MVVYGFISSDEAILNHQYCWDLKKPARSGVQFGKWSLYCGDGGNWAG